MSSYSRQKAEKREEQKKFINYNDVIEKITEHQSEIVYTSKGNPEPESLRIILEEKHNITLSSAETMRVIKRGKIKKPEVFTKEIEK